MSLASQPDNRALQDEIEAINSIYDPETLSITTTAPNSSTTVVLKFPLHPFSFLLSFSEEYPDSPPRIDGTQSTGDGGKGEGETAVNVLRQVVARVWQAGQVCLFDLIEEADPLLRRVHGRDPGREDDQTTSESHSPRSPDHEDLPPLNQDATASQSKPTESETAPRWTVSTPITSKKSTFLARAARVDSKSQAQQFIAHLVSTDKRVASATHNITAYRIRSDHHDPAITVQDCDDDGETAAGGRLLHLLQLMDAWNVVVVVSRWFGGVLLGSDRFRIINAVARDALVSGGFVADGGGDGKNKKKGKGKK